MPCSVKLFDAVKNVLAAAGIRMFIKSRFHLMNLREATIFVLIAVIIVPLGTAFWGAAFTVSNNFGTRLLGRVAQPQCLEWSDSDRAGAGHPDWRTAAFHKGSRCRTQAHPGGMPPWPRPSSRSDTCAFDRSPAGPGTSPALLYAPVPVLIWAALRFGFGGISTSMLVITMLAIWGTMQGRGPFLTQTPSENAFALQLFLLMVATPLMLLAVAIEDERRSKEALRVSEERMSLAVESAQMALWDWDLTGDRSG